MTLVLYNHLWDGPMMDMFCNGDVVALGYPKYMGSLRVYDHGLVSTLDDSMKNIFFYHALAVVSVSIAS